VCLEGRETRRWRNWLLNNKCGHISFFFPVLQVGPSVFAHGGQAPTTELHPDPILYYKEQHSPVGGVGGTLIPFHVWAGFDEPGEK
jgi:hypothetical protein